MNQMVSVDENVRRMERARLGENPSYDDMGDDTWDDKIAAEMEAAEIEDEEEDEDEDEDDDADEDEDDEDDEGGKPCSECETGILDADDECSNEDCPSNE